MQRRILLLVFVAATAGCASSGALPAGPPTEAETLTRLEQLRSADPSDVAVAVRLGLAYQRAGDLERARAELESATALPEAPPSAWAYLGAVAEEQEDWAAAEAAYREWGERGDAAAREAAAARLRLVERELLAAQARALLARESELAGEAPDPSVVAVMPLLVEGPEEYQALGRGVAELLTTDLSLTDRLRVVERAQLTALLQEMKLTLGGYVDPRTAARTGALTGAGRVVQGIVQDPGPEGVGLEASVVTAASPTPPVRITREGGLEELFDLEAELALAIYRELGVELTSVEVARIRERPTSNLQAFLAFSRGLESMDAGAFDEARTHFQEATQLDPGFQEAAQVQQQATTLSTARATPPAQAATDAAPAPEVTTEVAAAQAAPPPETGSTMEGLTSSVANAGASAATETTSAAAASTSTTSTESPGTGTGQSSSSPSTRGEGVLVDRVVEWTLQRPNPILLWWRW